MRADSLFRAVRIGVVPLLLAACADRVTGPVRSVPDPGTGRSSELECRVNVRARTLGCSQEGGAGGPRKAILGGQGVNVRLASSNLVYDSATQEMRVDVTVQNLGTGVLGTYHGDQIAGINVFFHRQPTATAGQGSVETANMDGAGSFTDAEQPFFSYAAVLQPNQVSPARTWKFNVPNSVEGFAFSVYVEAPRQGPRPPPVYGIFQQVAPEGGGCGLLVNGDAYCWGYGGQGRLGYGGTRNFTDPVPVTGGHKFKQIASSAHTCGVTTSRDLYCWGRNDHGEVGAPPTVVVEGQFYGNTRHNPEPALVRGGIRWDAVDVGPAFTCGLASDGRAWCWGVNDNGQVGNGTFTSQPEPALVSGDHRFTAITTGAYNACGLKAGGEVWCWGSNRHRALGAPSTQICGQSFTYLCSNVPVKVDTDVAFTAIDAGTTDHVCGLTAQGKAFCWGGNVGYEASPGANTDSILTPIALPTQERFVTIAAAGRETCAVRADGEGFCWGVGNGDPYGTVKAMAPGYAWRELRPGGSRVRCGVTRELGEAYCWGRENLGQLGNGGHHEQSFTTPQQLAPLHVYDEEPQAGFDLKVSGREASSYIDEPLWAGNDEVYSDDDFGLVRFIWSWGDGTTSEGRVARHSYARNGEYPVTLTVIDSSGQRSMKTKNATIWIYEGP
ncbi:PKD domain-containing protein [Longimicrobium terrae]|uniref:PKD domain-containing protein n=1 Tax=Longimicrobium terrae TaxID=1639882 RepID=A0A841H7G6_9BACT|nr:PKD domain-containing protein [Longimicrobium terrae]MBB4639511.1 hypothetical protein [Longimicrobium terrae]MBB6073883.1 hypothetical protein [Longimicrobium terrae]NNC32499.1 PKD domain-containing protein [Longimicrobium terrae]